MVDNNPNQPSLGHEMQGEKSEDPTNQSTSCLALVGLAQVKGMKTTKIWGSQCSLNKISQTRLGILLLNEIKKKKKKKRVQPKNTKI